MFKQLFTAVTAVVALSSASAFATTYNYSATNPSGSAGGGDVTDISLTYSDTAERLSGSFTVAENNGRIADTGWMVLSGGANPKGSEGDYGIMYMDFVSGDSWLYQYNGENNPSSYMGAPLLAYFDNAMTVSATGSTRSASFNYDLSGVSAPSSTWSGMGFGDQVGVWFHGLVGSFDADADGIDGYDGDMGHQFWHDTSYSTTTEVDVPEIDAAGIPLAAGLLLSLMAFFRERKNLFGKRSAK
ncbi:MAG: hypothetical protein ACI93R_001104 [Flavobacteriales bacterium]